MKAWRQLKEKAAHSQSEKVGDMAEVTYQCLRVGETFNVRDEFRHFDRVDEVPSPCLTRPTTNRGWSGPRIKGRIQFYGPEMGRIVLNQSAVGKPDG